MTAVLLVGLKVSVAALLLAIGMGSRPSDVAYLWRRPALLARSILAMYLVVPLAVFALVLVLPVTQPVKAALLVLAVSAGAPLLPRRLSAAGGGEYVFSLVITSSLLAVVLVPAWVALLAAYFDVRSEISYWTVAGALAQGFLLPLAIGMAVNAFRPKAGAWLAGKLTSFAGIGLIVSGVLLLAVEWEILLHMNWKGVGALVCALLLALAIGHVMGGPKPEERTALAVCCATRHIGVALLVASSFPGSRTLVLMIAYVLSSLAVTVPYLRWRRKTAKMQAI